MRHTESSEKKGRFIPLEKQSKKNRRKQYALCRGNWGAVNPVTKVVPSAKAYRRKQERQQQIEWD